MKKIISYFLSGIVLCTALLVTPVSAAEVAPAEETITINSTVSVRATNYWTKTTTKLNSVYGTASNISTVSSGSVSGSNPQILKIEVYSRVSSGSDSFYLYVEDGNGNVNYTTVSKSGTITINDCNGVQREHNKKLNNGLPILRKVPPKRDYGRYFCIMAEKGGTSHGGLTEKLSLFFHAKKQEVNAYGR